MMGGSLSRHRSAAVLAIASVVLVAWVQRRALASFFAADDLWHLAQARDFLPTPHMPWRVLTQVAYFRIMVAAFGAAPAPYFAVNFALHLVNCVILFAVVRRLDASRPIAAMTSILFGACPLFVSVLFRAVTINDILSLTGVLLAAYLRLGARPFWALLPFTLGILCKESILGFPFLFLTLAIVHSRRLSSVDVALAAISLSCAALFVVLRQSGLSPTGVPYAVHLGANVFHNAMTYVVRETDLIHPLPDLVSSFDRSAWQRAVPVLLILCVAGRYYRRKVNHVWIGLLAWATALLPVLLLENSTYGHYTYVAHAGLALSLAAALEFLVGRALSRVPATLLHPVTAQRVASAFLALGALGYAARGDMLIERRLELRVANSDLPLDPFLRGIVIVRGLAIAMHERLPEGARKGLIYSPDEDMVVLGARSGQRYSGTRRQQTSYDLVEAISDTGAALRIFAPTLDSTAFIHEWHDRYVEWEVFVPLADGSLWHAGHGLDGAKAMARFMTTNRWSKAGVQMLAIALRRWEDDTELRFAYSISMHRAGKRMEALDQLAEIVRRNPTDPLARRAREILAAVRERRVAAVE